MGDLELQVFADRLKEYRTKMGITQKDFAEKIGITAAALSAYENNVKNPSISVAKRIADTFGISIDWLCGLSSCINIDEQPTTYADLLRLIIKISNTEMEFDKWDVIFVDPNNGNPAYGILRTDNRVISYFFDEWRKMYDLFNEHIIDEHLYTLWLNDKLKQYENYSLKVQCDIDPDFDQDVAAAANPDQGTKK